MEGWQRLHLLCGADVEVVLQVVAEVESTLAAIGASHGNGQWRSKLMVRDAIADITLQQVLTRPKEFSVIATMNLNGDYLSDALAAQVCARLVG